MDNLGREKQVRARSQHEQRSEDEDERSTRYHSSAMYKNVSRSIAHSLIASRILWAVSSTVICTLHGTTKDRTGAEKNTTSMSNAAVNPGHVGMRKGGGKTEHQKRHKWEHDPSRSRPAAFMGRIFAAVPVPRKSPRLCSSRAGVFAAATPSWSTVTSCQGCNTPSTPPKHQCLANGDHTRLFSRIYAANVFPAWTAS